jgi:hypothetical protein
MTVEFTPLARCPYPGCPWRFRSGPDRSCSDDHFCAVVGPQARIPAPRAAERVPARSVDYRTAQQVARKVGRKLGAHADDVTQEIVVWWLTNAVRIEQAGLTHQQIVRVLHSAAETYVRAKPDETLANDTPNVAYTPYVPAKGPLAEVAACKHCGAPVEQADGAGRPREYCATSCGADAKVVRRRAARHALTP